MALRIPEISQIRWLTCYNDGVSEVPAFGAVAVTGCDSFGRLTVGRPSKHGQDVLINGPSVIPVGAYGVCTPDDPICALYETGDGTPSINQLWGAESNSYKLNKDRPGFAALGGATGGRAFFRRRVGRFLGAEVSGTNSVAGLSVLFSFSSTAYDVGGFATSGTNNLWTPTDGYYLVGAAVSWSGTGAGGPTGSVGVSINAGVGFIAGVTDPAFTPPNGVGGPDHTVTTLVKLNAGVGLKLYLSQSVGGTLTAVVDRFWATRLGVTDE